MPVDAQLPSSMETLHRAAEKAGEERSSKVSEIRYARHAGTLRALRHLKRAGELGERLAESTSHSPSLVSFV